LRWSEVKPLIEEKLAGLDAEIVMFAPDGPPPASALADVSTRPKMTAGKAALVQLIDRYARTTMGASLIEIQKLMYFLQIAGEPLNLEYNKGLYGPYADNLRHVLSRVEGHFLSGFGDGTGSVLEAEPIEVLPGAATEADDVVAGCPDLQNRIERVLSLAEGFESAYGMELLATVHWAATHEGCADRSCVVDTVHGWNDRKERLFTPGHINTAVDQLVEHGWFERASFAS
jgi:O-acetyl-ADP-ribose deacetylase (regulator of RNase III)